MKSFVLGVVVALSGWVQNPAVLADGSGPGSGHEVVCKTKAQGKGFITVAETEKCFHFDFKVESKHGETKGHFAAFDEETGVCITGARVTNLEQIDEQTLSIDFEVIFGKDQAGTVNIVVRDNGKSEECDSFEIALAEGVSIAGNVGRGCRCDWGHIKVDVKCKEKCEGGAYCPGHPHCDEHPVCKGKNCKGHKDCEDRDDDDEGEGHDGDDDDGDQDGGPKCKGHKECKPKCKGGKYCPGHPICKDHPICEVPSCKGHKKCKDAKCKGHPECRKQYKHKKGCKAKVNAKNRCSCKTIKR